MLAAPKQLEHSTGCGNVGWLTKDFAIAFGHGVAPQYEPAADSPSNVGRLFVGQPSDQFGRAFAAANAAFDRFGRRDDFELIPGFRQQFAASRRSAGKD
jgi:hypothetical protein